MKKTARGFNVYTEFTDSYGSKIRVQESSSAMKPHVWIFSDNPEDGKTGADGNPTKMAPHLTKAQAKKVADALYKWLEISTPAEQAKRHYELLINEGKKQGKRELAQQLREILEIEPCYHDCDCECD